MNKNYILYGNKTYYFDVNKIIEFSLKSEEKNIRDSEITEGYEKLDEESNVLTLTSRVIRENTGTSNPQNDMITYDIFKMMLFQGFLCFFICIHKKSHVHSPFVLVLPKNEYNNIV